MLKIDYQVYSARPFRGVFATHFRCLIPRCGDMQGPGCKHIDGHGIICNVMHDENRSEYLLGI